MSAIQSIETYLFSGYCKQFALSKYKRFQLFGDMKAMSARLLYPGRLYCFHQLCRLRPPGISNGNLRKEGRIKRNGPWGVVFRCAGTKSSIVTWAFVARDGRSMSSIRGRPDRYARVAARKKRTRVRRSIFSLFFRNERVPLVGIGRCALERAPRRFLRRPGRLNNCVLQRPRERLAELPGVDPKKN